MVLLSREVVAAAVAGSGLRRRRRYQNGSGRAITAAVAAAAAQVPPLSLQPRPLQLLLLLVVFRRVFQQQHLLFQQQRLLRLHSRRSKGFLRRWWSPACLQETPLRLLCARFSRPTWLISLSMRRRWRPRSLRAESAAPQRFARWLRTSWRPARRRPPRSTTRCASTDHLALRLLPLSAQPP